MIILNETLNETWRQPTTRLEWCRVVYVIRTCNSRTWAMPRILWTLWSRSVRSRWVRRGRRMPRTEIETSRRGWRTASRRCRRCPALQGQGGRRAGCSTCYTQGRHSTWAKEEKKTQVSMFVFTSVVRVVVVTFQFFEALLFRKVAWWLGLFPPSPLFLNAGEGRGPHALPDCSMSGC